MKNSRHALDLSTVERKVLYADEHLIAIDKPPALPSHATLDPKRANLSGLVSELLMTTESAESYVGEVHRLDVGTSGVILFGKTPAATVHLCEQFRERQVRKTYLALSATSGGSGDSGQSRSQWRTRDHLAPDPRDRMRMRSVRSGGSYAETEFAVRETRHGFALIEARPVTGRRHQIRVHLAGAGLPILGDRTYAPPTIAGQATRLMLHALTIRLAHPVLGTPLEIHAPIPEDFAAVWEKARSRR